MIIAAWHMITDLAEYHDLGAITFSTRLDRQRHTRHLVTQLQHLRYTVQLNPEQNGRTAARSQSDFR